MTEIGDVPPGVDPTRPTPARLYDYFLGGTNNFPADRQMAEQLKAGSPDVVDALLANRGFHRRRIGPVGCDRPVHGGTGSGQLPGPVARYG